ncbi:MAG: type III-B CRISPR-associated protein Cas10/Cmr2 [Candidatus Omnitrophica bacterium]|nr:type III-B CRISPR-associated protein Cas10/Cmr2 [Candidatus Omnitrophota bacterium]
MSVFTEKLKAFLHDPVDKCLQIQTHIERARNYAEKIGVTSFEEVKGPDIIASCMERSLCPSEILQNSNQIKHPLSKGEINIPEINAEEVFSVVEESFEEIGREIRSYDEVKKFLYLWRNLLENLIDKSSKKLFCKYLPLFPADTRIPDHSIWEHLKIASAVNAYLLDNKLIQNNSLFLFTIGPVQSFISQARKTQDFYVGSFILSYLTFIGMKLIIDRYGPTSIIYPDLFNQPLMDWFLEREKKIQVNKSNLKFINIPTIPNRFVAIIPLTDAKEIKDLAENMKQNTFEELDNIKSKILQKLNLNEERIKNVLEKQLVDFPQIYWVAIPWRKGENDITIEDLKKFFKEEELIKWCNLWNFAEKKGAHKPNIGLIYQLLYTALEKSMGARKNLREFKQFKEAGRKCSVCGEKNVLFFCETKNKDKFKKHNPEAIDLTQMVNVKYLSDGEGLCGLCFIKRTFKIYLEEKVDESFKDLSFPSTSEIAVADFKNKALEKAKKELEEYEKLLKDFPIVFPVPKLKNRMPKTVEGEWFFEENLRKEFIKKELNIDLTDEDIERLKRSLKNLVEKTGKPNPYYALIYLDGDNMGKWLSGELHPEIENAYNSETWKKLPLEFKKEIETKLIQKPLTPAIHSSISTALRHYSIEFVKKIVEEEHLGKLVYSGGDDILAFVNLKDLIDVMKKLRFAFSGEVKFENGEVKVDIENNTGFVEKDNRYILTMGKNATTSMGVVIAHYKEPLKIVINKVFEMGKRAKSNPDKDSFSILLMKKSGEERIAIYKWRYNNIFTTDIIKKAKETMDDEQKRYISHNFIQKLKREFMKLKSEDGHLLTSSLIFNESLIRLISRAYNYKDKKDNKKEKVEFIKRFYNSVVELFWVSGGNIDNFTNLLEIASFLNKGD